LIERVRIIRCQKTIRIDENIAVILPGIVADRLKDSCKRWPWRLHRNNLNLVICNRQGITGKDKQLRHCSISDIPAQAIIDFKPAEWIACTIIVVKERTGFWCVTSAGFRFSSRDRIQPEQLLRFAVLPQILEQKVPSRASVPQPLRQIPCQ